MAYRWGYAKDYVEAMWLMLQKDTPDDYVIATGKAHSVREFVEAACRTVGVEIEWRVEGSYEKGYIGKFNESAYSAKADFKEGDCLIEVDARYFRPTEVDFLQGDSSTALDQLGWKPTTDMQALADKMIAHDYRLSSDEYRLKNP